MAFPVILPKQGWSMDEARFVAWLKKPGDTVQAGEPLFSVETDKAIQEIEALDAGILHLLPKGPQEGDMIKIGDLIGYLLAPGESAPAAASVPSVPAVPAAAAPAAPAAPVAAAAPAAPASTTPVSPRAARRAIAAGVDLRTVRGTGKGGRIREADVLAAQATPATPVTPAAPAIPSALRGLRRTIAERMLRSKTETAPVTLTTRVDATALVTLRGRLKSAGTEPVPSYNDMLMKLVAGALREHPALNGQAGAINISLAVDTEEGLLAPVVRDVPGLTLQQVAEQSADLVARARVRKLTAEELSGGTFTITNLGAMGVDAFTPIINLPECAVLGVGRIVREPVVVGDAVVAQDRVWLSLTFDHRLVDGAPAARFLDSLRKAVEQPPPGVLK
jgi:pyruvate dehydrogenase E2 component (dihydrolipoamide acetyltransferase)